MARLPSPLVHRLLPLLGHRVLVVDGGSRCLKLLVVDRTLGRIRVVHRQTIDLEAEGGAEFGADAPGLGELLPELGSHGRALVLPQHRTITEVVALPEGGREEVRHAIEAEALRLSGLGETGLAHGYVRLAPFGGLGRPAMLTLCKRDEVDDLVDRFAEKEGESERNLPSEAPIVEVVTTAEALFAAAQMIKPLPADAVLVELGASHTVVGIRLERQGVFATSFPTGTDQFNQALARLQQCPLVEADALRQSRDLLSGEARVEGFAAVVTNWQTELRQSVTEWLEDHPSLGRSLTAFPVYLCGGGALQPGLFEFLDRAGGWKFHRWPANVAEGKELPMERYWAAYGAALQALGRSPRRLSLLPETWRSALQRRRMWERLQAAILVGLLCVAAVLGFGLWKSSRLAAEKQALSGRTQAALEAVRQLGALASRVAADHASVEPVLERQRQTLEVLQTLAAIRAARTNNDFWYVLFADAASYAQGTTGQAAVTNAHPTGATPAGAQGAEPAAGARREYVVELCIPQDGDALRRILSTVVTNLKQNPLFDRVDALPPERKRDLVDPKVAISNHVFAVAMEVATPRPLGYPVVAAPATNPPPNRSRTGLGPDLRLSSEGRAGTNTAPSETAPSSNAPPATTPAATNAPAAPAPGTNAPPATTPASTNAPPAAPAPGTNAPPAGTNAPPAAPAGATNAAPAGTNAAPKS